MRKRRQTSWRRLVPGIVAVSVIASPTAVGAQNSTVAGTLHNLSVSGPGEIKATEETEICKFCHIPHSAIVSNPLWGHALSEAEYAVPELGRRDIREPAPQPDGSSRLCLSCHDGTVALGDVAGLERPLRMQGAERLTPGRRGFLGTDLTGDHPISFVVPKAPPALTGDQDMAFVPLDVILEDDDVELDAAGKMQCTTCHDPHADRHYVPGQVPRFWVKSTVNEVCLTCHVLR